MAAALRPIYSNFYTPEGWIQIEEGVSFFDDKPVVTDAVKIGSQVGWVSGKYSEIITA